MNRSVLVVTRAASVLITAISPGVFAQSTVVHHLTVAANSTLYIDNSDADSIIADMNRIIAAKKFSWDVACPSVTFVRDGDVIQSDGLLTTGTYQQLADSGHLNAPNANVLVVSSINCSGIQAAGCSPASGGEPMVVGTYKGFDSQLWLHERGHNVMLPHSADSGADTAVPQSIGFRFMFWRLGVGHEGKTQTECSHFSTRSLASIAVTASGAALAAAAGPPPRSHEMMIAAALPAPEVATQDSNEELAGLAKQAGLTVPAFRVVAPPWVEATPVEEIKSLGAADLASIRTMLQGEPNQYWPQALSTLAVAGASADVAVIKHALELPVPAVAPDAVLDKPTKERLRLLMQIKLAAPSALGILANRTHSSAAVETLKATTDVSRATTLIGPRAATFLSKSALTGLSLSNSAAAETYLNEVVKSVPGAAPGGKHNVAPLTKKETEQLVETAAAVKKHGIEAYLKLPSGGP